MIEGVEVPHSPAWWLKNLATALQDRRQGRKNGKRWHRGLDKPARVAPGLDLLHDHLAGDPPLLGVAAGWREGFREVARLGRLNVAALVVEAKANRMPLRGFRTAAADDELGDQVARDIMRANNMPVRSREVHNHMLALRDGYAMVTPPANDGEWPIITAEDPRETITAEDPATGRTLAGLKMYRDEWDSADYAYLFIRGDDGRVTKHVARKKGASSITDAPFRMMSKSWEWVGDPESTKGGLMPIVRFPNRNGVGEYERHLDTLDRINDQILNKLVVAKVQAFRQRAIKGLPDTRKVVKDGKFSDEKIDYSDAFVSGPGELWKVPAEAEFWESSPVDLGPIRLSIKDDVEYLAACTSTPLHVIAPDAASGSAEGASLMREEHVYAVEACRDHADRAWAEVMALCFAYMGDEERAQATRIEPIWGPAERYSLPARADAAQKATGSLPVEAIQTDIWQYDPADVPNLRQLAGRDMLLTGDLPEIPGDGAAELAATDGADGGADAATA